MMPTMTRKRRPLVLAVGVGLAVLIIGILDFQRFQNVKRLVGHRISLDVSKMTNSRGINEKKIVGQLHSAELGINDVAGFLSVWVYIEADTIISPDRRSVSGGEMYRLALPMADVPLIVECSEGAP